MNFDQNLVQNFALKLKSGNIHQAFLVQCEGEAYFYQSFFFEVLLRAQIPLFHPDIFYISRFDDIGTQRTTKAGSKKERNYSINHPDIEQLPTFLDRSKIELPFKIVIIEEAHTISNVIWNKWLKVIEDPSAPTLFIFLIDSMLGILPTIKSRCLYIYPKPINKLPPPPLFQKYFPQNAISYETIQEFKNNPAEYKQLLNEVLTHKCAHPDSLVDIDQTLQKMREVSLKAKFNCNLLNQIPSFIKK